MDRRQLRLPDPGVSTRLTLSRVLQTRLACSPAHTLPAHLVIDGDRRMGLGDLTSRQAVLAAMAEFDRLGRDAFLAKYEFGKARDYFLVVDGRSYDSKAIVGAAHGYQFQHDGALGADAFSGGDATVRRKLAELGFTVERGSNKAERLTDGYWVFACNPRKWAIDRFLERGAGQRDTWGIRPSDSRHFAPGQLAIIRVGVDRRSDAERQVRPKLEAGIYALCEVESPAYPGAGANDEFWAPDAARAPGHACLCFNPLDAAA